MFKFKLLVFLSLLLAGCSKVTDITIDPVQVYQGYPCGQNCPAFRTGFDTAQTRQFTSDLDCAALPLDQVSGCQTYLFESRRTQPDYSDLKLK